MFESLESIPRQELEGRWAAARRLLTEHVPQAGGLMAFSRVNVYYLSGTFNAGVFWLPLEGEPVLFVRRGLERAMLESAVARISTFRSYADLPELAQSLGAPLSATVAAEKNGLPWALGESLTRRLPDTRLVPGDFVLARARSVKTDFELAKMRLCGERHHKCLHDVLPGRLRVGMNEREISHAVWEVFFEHGHMGMMRMGAFGEEIFLGHVAAGDSGNYPSAFDGPLGLRGEHPAVPFMGYRGKIWQPGEPLALDVGFTLEGYSTDKTQVLWAGERETIPDEARRGHEFCMEIQSFVAENLRPGAVPSDIYGRCMDKAEAQGMSEGFMAPAHNKVRFIGHGIGLTIDGYPVIARGFDEPLEANQVLAVEPKYGIEGLGMVGVENTFVVTESGGECLTGNDFEMVCVG